MAIDTTDGEKDGKAQKKRKSTNRPTVDEDNFITSATKETVKRPEAVSRKQKQIAFRFLQTNLKRLPITHDLLEVMTQKYGTHLCLLSEPNTKRIGSTKGTVVTDERKNTAIYWYGKGKAMIRGNGKGNGLVWVVLENVAVLYSCYFSPNRSTEEFESFLDDLGQSIQKQRTGRRIIITGHFSSKIVT